MKNIPLCVDLDGTLIKADLLWLSFVAFLKSNPFNIFFIILWTLKGRSFLKEKLALKVKLNISKLPYRQKFISFLRSQKNNGRQVVLITATHQKLAEAVAQHLQIFDEVYGTHRHLNLKGKTKASFLVNRFGHGLFDYAGDSKHDLYVWGCARKSILVNVLPVIEEKLKKTINNIDLKFC